MHLRRLMWVFFAALVVQGCNGTQEKDAMPPASYEDDFGESITEENVQFDEMIKQRAQIEFTLGAQKPLELFGSDSSDTDAGVSFGVKFAFEVFKNVFMGILFNYGNYDVNEPSTGQGGQSPGRNQIDLIESYDKMSFLLTTDYDIPLWDEDDGAPIFRFGAGFGLNVEKFKERPETINTIQSFWSIIFRPAISLRYPIGDFLVIGEASYDLIPQRNLETNEGGALVGQKAVFSSIGLWLGLAYEWD